MPELTIYNIKELLEIGRFGHILTSKDVPAIPIGKVSRPIPGKWVAQQISGMWYIELGAIDDWHDFMLDQLIGRVGESETGFSDGLLIPLGGTDSEIEVRVGRNTASIPLEVQIAVAEALKVARRNRKIGA